MENNKFFKLVWRINGVLILGTALLILLAVGYQAISQMLRFNHTQAAPTVENLADDPQGKEKWVIGRPLPVNQGDFILLPLVSENKEVENVGVEVFASKSYNMFEGGYYGDPSKNVLFLNTQDNSAFWLFKGVDRLILDITLFPGGYDYEGPTKAIFYKVIAKDTNSDNKLSKEDAASLYISEPNGKNYQRVLSAYDRIISRDLVSDNRMMVIYQHDGKAYSKLIQLSPYTEVSNVELPKVE
ncbi:hypothetical protein [Pseudoalteromonas sp. GB56]